MTILFFDDTRLYNREGMTREYGMPEVVSREEFQCDEYALQWPNGLWRTEDGIYHMILLLQADGARFLPLAYYSQDGENWLPDNRAEGSTVKNIKYPNQCFDADTGIEAAYFIYDTHDIPQCRYKIIANKCDNEARWCDDIMYCSEDCFNWKLMRGASWNSRGAEPGVSSFYNPLLNTNIVVCRPTWGDRRICVVKTDNFQSFTYPELAMMPDSEDNALVEHYGMLADCYKNYFIGFLWLYNCIHTNQNKFWEGKVDCQLAYSVNGTHWQRSLRKPFIANGEEGTYNAGMVYPSKFIQLDDGSIRIYGGAFAKEHGHFYSEGSFVIYKLREDGFVRLVAGENGGKVFTKPIVLHGGFDINLKGRATCAVYDSSGGKPLAGFTHEECIAFDGDDTHWIPKWQNADLEKLKGKCVCLEIKLENGELYAINGNIQPITVHEAIRYNRFGTLLDGKGF